MSLMWRYRDNQLKETMMKEYYKAHITMEDKPEKIKALMEALLNKGGCGECHTEDLSS